MNPWVFVAGLVLLGGAYGAGRLDGGKIERAGEAKAEEVQRIAGNAMTAAAVDAIKGLRPQFTTINQPLQKEFHDEVRYSSAACSHTDAAWGLLDRAYQAAGGQSFGGGPVVPAAAAAAGSDATGNNPSAR